jgi:hypothetical protein
MAMQRMAGLALLLVAALAAPRAPAQEAAAAIAAPGPIGGLPGGDQAGPGKCTTGYCGKTGGDKDKPNTRGADTPDSGCPTCSEPPLAGPVGNGGPSPVGMFAKGSGAQCSATSCPIGKPGDGFNPLSCANDVCGLVGPALPGLGQLGCAGLGLGTAAAKCLAGLTPCQRKDDSAKDIALDCLDAACGLAGLADKLGGKTEDLCDNLISNVGNQIKSGGGALTSCGIMDGIEKVLNKCGLRTGKDGLEIIPPPPQQGCDPNQKVCCEFKKPGGNGPSGCSVCCSIKADSAGQCGCDH